MKELRPDPLLPPCSPCDPLLPLTPCSPRPPAPPLLLPLLLPDPLLLPRGYRGRFVRFRWPTFTGLTSYNDSEYRAWKCGVSLKQYLSTLPSAYTVNLVAHSMGNIVAGSALEKGASVANYALLNAAVPAICYDTSGTVVQTSWGYVTPNDDPDSTTRSLSYQGRLANVSGNLVNFFLAADSALAAWEINNDSPSGGRYPVAGARPHQWPEASINAGYRYQPTAAAGQKLRVVRVAGERLLNSADEAMGFAVQAPSLTAGADGRTRGSIDDWVDMAAYGFDSVHSAEFLFTIRRYDRMLWMAGWEGNLGVLKPTKKKCLITTRQKKSSMKRIVSQR